MLILEQEIEEGKSKDPVLQEDPQSGRLKLELLHDAKNNYSHIKSLFIFNQNDLGRSILLQPAC